MTLDEAMKELWEINKRVVCVTGSNQDNALKLGIEALKFRQRCQEVCGDDPLPLLPGEGEENEFEGSC